MINMPLEYAKALYELAVEMGAEDEVLEEMSVVVDILNENPKYLSLLEATNVPADERIELVSKAFGNALDKNLLNFIKILVKNKKMRHFEFCRKEFLKLYNAAHGRESVMVITALPLKDEQKESLIKKLEKLLSKEIIATYQVDKECLGGVILRFENRQIDGSVKGKLDALGRQIVSTIA